MILEIDIWRCASELIKQYGDLADIEAAARADECEAKGDREGQRVWLRILRTLTTSIAMVHLSTKDHVFAMGSA